MFSVMARDFRVSGTKALRQRRHVSRFGYRRFATVCAACVTWMSWARQGAAEGAQLDFLAGYAQPLSGEVNPHGAGIGLRGGYTLPSGLYLGLSGGYHPGRRPSDVAFGLLQLEVGLELPISALMLRPYLGLGAAYAGGAKDQLCYVPTGACFTIETSWESGPVGSLGGVLLHRFGSWLHVGVDGRLSLTPQAAPSGRDDGMQRHSLSLGPAVALYGVAGALF